MSRPMTRRTPRLESLEARQLLSADLPDVTVEQQVMLELINEALVDPEAAADRVEQGLSRGAINAILNDGDTVAGVIAEIAEAEPRPPVALDSALMAAAARQSEHIIRLGYQTHQGPPGQETATDRVIAAGYGRPERVAENIILGVDGPEHAMRAFLADYGASNADDPHRENIQQTDRGKPSHQDAGVAILPVKVAVDASTPFGSPAARTETKYVVTQVFARKAESAPKVLGVVYDDADGNRSYDRGEGIANASVSIIDKATGKAATGDATELKTWTSGGYQAEVEPGEYRIEVRVGDRLIRKDAVVGEENVKVDFRVNEASATVATTSSTGSASGTKASTQQATPPATLAPSTPPTTPTPSTPSRADATTPATRGGSTTPPPASTSSSTSTRAPVSRPVVTPVQAPKPSTQRPQAQTQAQASRPASSPVAPPSLPTPSIDPAMLPKAQASASNPPSTPGSQPDSSKGPGRLWTLAADSEPTAAAVSTLLRRSTTVRVWSLAGGATEPADLITSS